MTPSLRALKTETPPATPAFQRKKHGIRASFGKGLMKLRGHKSSSEPNLGNGFKMFFDTSMQSWVYEGYDIAKYLTIILFTEAEVISGGYPSLSPTLRWIIVFN